MDELADFWVHTTVIHAGADIYGNPSTSTRTVAGFQSLANRLVITSTGEEVASGARVSYPPGTLVELGDWITLDGETTPRRIVSIARPTSKGLNLPDRIVVNLQ